MVFRFKHTIQCKHITRPGRLVAVVFKRGTRTTKGDKLFVDWPDGQCRLIFDLFHAIALQIIYNHMANIFSNAERLPYHAEGCDIHHLDAWGLEFAAGIVKRDI